jgi:hypothetical protein
MSLRIAYLFAAASCLTFIAPAGADPECFDGVCRMPEVVELPAPSEAPVAAEPSAASASAAAQPAGDQLRSGPAPEPVRPQMTVDDVPPPALRPLPARPVEKTVKAPVEKPAGNAMAKTSNKPVRQIARQAPPVVDDSVQPSEPVEVVSRRYAPAEPPKSYTLYSQPVPPSAGVVIVAPGAQYGEDGIVVANARQDSSWQLCQVDRPGTGHRCIQYNYQPYGAYGYRPLGTYRAYRSSPSYVYVPDAKVIAID